MRWDYEDVVGIDHDKNNFAPRFGVVWDVNGSGRTVLRANAGIYYDQIFLNIPLNAENAKKFVQTLISNPGYPRSERPQSQSHRRTDHADSELDAVCAGQPHAVHASRSRPACSVSSAARSRSPPTWSARAASGCCDRPTPTIRTWTIRRGRGRIRRSSASRSSRRKGNSWYTGLQVGIEKRLSQRHTYTVAYTLSETERNTEDFNFFPMDNRFYDLERGPASNDARHRVSAAFTLQLPWRDPGRHARRGAIEAALQHHDRRRRQPRHADQRSARGRRPQLRPRRLAVPGGSPLDQVAADARASAWS